MFKLYACHFILKKGFRLAFFQYWLICLMGSYGTHSILIQHHNSEAAFFHLFCFFSVQLSHPYDIMKISWAECQMIEYKGTILYLKMLFGPFKLTRVICLLISWPWIISLLIIDLSNLKLSSNLFFFCQD